MNLIEREMAGTLQRSCHIFSSILEARRHSVAQNTSLRRRRSKFFLSFFYDV